MVTWDDLECTSDELEHAHSLFDAHGVICLADSLAPEVLQEAKHTSQRITAELLKVRARRAALGLLGDGVFREICCRDGERFDVELQDEEPFATLGTEGTWCEVVRRILGDDMRLWRSGLMVASCTETGDHQQWHTDGGQLFEDGPHLPCHCLTVMVPLIDFTTENGATEFCLGTHMDLDQYPNGEVTAECTAGSAYLFDYRIVHRGTANCTSEDRTALYFTYTKPWFDDPTNYTYKNSNTSIMDFCDPMLQDTPHLAAGYPVAPVSQVVAGSASGDSADASVATLKMDAMGPIPACGDATESSAVTQSKDAIGPGPAADATESFCVTQKSDASCSGSVTLLIDSFIASPKLMLPRLITLLSIPANRTELDELQVLKVLTALCQLLMSVHTSTVRESAAETMTILATDDNSMCDLVRNAGALQLLVALMADTGALPSAQGAAARTLKCLALNSANEDAIREAGAFPPLVALLSSKSLLTEVRKAAAHALQFLATNTANEDAIRHAGGIFPLMELVADGSTGVALRERAALALQNLSTNLGNQEQICASGGLLSLQELAANAQEPKTLRLAAESILRNLDKDYISVISTKWSPPGNWDMSVEFSQRLIVATGSEPPHDTIRRQIVRGRPTRGVEIHFIDCVEHPCHGQRGLFAATTIPKGALIVQYTGVVKNRVSGDVHNDYLFAFRGTDLDIDSKHVGNESRYINDYHGTGLTRNVQFKEAWVASAGSVAPEGAWLAASECVLMDELVVWVQALRTIKAGEELLISYGSQYGIDSAEEGSSDDEGDNSSGSANGNR